MGTGRLVRWVSTLAVGVMVSACAPATYPTTGRTPPDPASPPVPAVSPNLPTARPSTDADTSGPSAVRLLFGGDVMLGRGVAQRTAEDPSAALAGVRDQVRAADLAAANLESPLTTRKHSPRAGPYALEAPPLRAALLAEAGFDVAGVANNHSGDAGPATVPDTMAALGQAGLVAVGGGADVADAFTPRVVDVRGVRVALLAVDATGAGPRAGADRPGVAWWDDARLRTAVTQARADGDLVVVGMHGGVEYLSSTDPGQARRAYTLARWGVDVVWGHHPHVVQPVTTIDPDGDGRRTVVATSLGNLVFDQRDPDANRGLLLEVLAGADGVRAVRLGDTTIEAGRASFARWRTPAPGVEAALVDGTWWQLVSPMPADAAVRPDAATRQALSRALAPGDLLDAVSGDLDGDGEPEVVATFRRPYRPTDVSRLLPADRLVDPEGRSAHVGVYRTGDLAQRWVAGTLIHPVALLVACDGWLAVALSSLDDAATPIAVGAWRWRDFGFVTYPELPGAARPACADVDGDGALDPLAVGRIAP